VTQVGRRCTGADHPAASQRALPKASPARLRTATVPGSTESRPTRSCPGRDAARPYRIVPRRSAALALTRFGERTRPRVPPTAPRRRHGNAVHPHRLWAGASPEVGRRCTGAVQAAAPQRGLTKSAPHPAANLDGAGLDRVSPHRRLPRPGRSPALPDCAASLRGLGAGSIRGAHAPTRASDGASPSARERRATPPAWAARLRR
jgi:hypothetical protein